MLSFNLGRVLGTGINPGCRVTEGRFFPGQRHSWWTGWWWAKHRISGFLGGGHVVYPMLLPYKWIIMGLGEKG